MRRRSKQREIDRVAALLERLPGVPPSDVSDRVCSLCQLTIPRLRRYSRKPGAPFWRCGSRACTARTRTNLSASPRLDEPKTADALLDERSDEFALLLSGECEPLSVQQKTEMLRHRISYLADDLVVPTWSSAFVYDTERGAQALLEILEFANSQLLQFRYYDDLLDVQLGRIYAHLQQPRWYDAVGGRRYSRAAHDLQSLFIDVNELTDRTENALKMVGDIYAARVYALTESRLGLDHWKTSMQEKLKTLNDIYRFAIEQTGIARGHLLEITIILILLFEFALFFMGIMT